MEDSLDQDHNNPEEFKKRLLHALRSVNERLELLFEYQMKFDPRYFDQIDATKLEILALVMHHPVNMKKLGERQRRELLKTLIRELKVRKMTFDEISNIWIALGFPKKKQSRFQRDIKEAVQRLVQEIKEGFYRRKGKSYGKKKKFSKKKGEKV
jgi:hypothetical protein